MRLIRYHQLAPLKGIDFSRQHIARLEAAGQFPKRVRLAGGDPSRSHYGYVEDELDAYIASRMAARETVDA